MEIVDFLYSHYKKIISSKKLSFFSKKLSFFRKKLSFFSEKLSFFSEKLSFFMKNSYIWVSNSHFWLKISHIWVQNYQFWIKNSHDFRSKLLTYFLLFMRSSAIVLAHLLTSEWRWMSARSCACEMIRMWWSLEDEQTLST